jgi:membrane-bound lytic murein transglycosylase D
MNKINNSTTLIFGVFILVSIILLSNKYSETAEQDNRMEQGTQVVSVPIPSHVSFAQEPVPLDKFEIKERLDRELTVNTYWQSNTLLILKKSQKYFQIIEPILARYGVPDDFKYLAVAESGLQPTAVSSSGAKGMWQFMSSSGPSYGLYINEEVDERYNVEKSTEAACMYLKDAYSRFGSWTLAAASYNRGMSGISKDQEKQFVNDYYDLHLNSETSRYVLRIIAYKLIMENPSRYNFLIEPKDYYGTPNTITLQLADTTIGNISEYAQNIGSNYHVIKSLNPWILGNSLSSTKRTYMIKAPTQ